MYLSISCTFIFHTAKAPVNIFWNSVENSTKNKAKDEVIPHKKTQNDAYSSSSTRGLSSCRKAMQVASLGAVHSAANTRLRFSP